MMTSQIRTYIDALAQAADAAVGYTEATHILDGASPADWTDMILSLLADEVKAGRMTEEESRDIQISDLPY